MIIVLTIALILTIIVIGKMSVEIDLLKIRLWKLEESHENDGK